jgi:hypothetical protein
VNLSSSAEAAAIGFFIWPVVARQQKHTAAPFINGNQLTIRLAASGFNQAWLANARSNSIRCAQHIVKPILENSVRDLGIFCTRHRANFVIEYLFLATSDNVRVEIFVVFM